MRFAISTVRAVSAPRLRKALAGLAVTAGLAFAVAPAVAQTLASLPAPTLAAEPVGAAKPILAWVGFCQGYPAECAVNAAEPARIAMTPAIWNTIQTINRRVNKSIVAITDMDHLGVPDRWDLAEDGSGDCEDFQLLKRSLLARAGLPRRAMRMTVVIDEKGEGHAVLTLITDRGDLVLDNKTSQILPWHRTGYTFIKRESQDAVAWVSLGGVTSPVTTANR
ncbi:transglutaminase-like cysteine peptidase [Methylobacterium sp. WL12]|uniref:transglutaminase-like cysteine peptidase n=1 Tax=Methylobacterium sp. WL12 TaxID=2603890 RepID=UPI0011C86C12|nr:transglutaminase-like cysteine peptidase [Methylobacterium sp. WL12]TXM74588.1 transglutaminase-like cysteine peptidase [Methylobacterium sp. WL12]